MNDPFFSIILPTYNRAEFISKAIGSVLAQTVKDFELIIIDDGSTDNTREKVSSFTDTRINYTFQRNQQKSAARNEGIKKAKGKYICFIDSDDHYLNDHLQVFFEEIKKRNEPIAVLYSFVKREQNGKTMDESVGNYSPTPGLDDKKNRIAEFLLFYSPLVQASCIHNAILKKNHFDPELKVTECYELMGKIACEYEFIKVEKRTAVIVGHGKNSTAFEKDFLLRYEKEWEEIIAQKEFSFLKSSSLFKTKMSNIYLGLGNFFIDDSNKAQAKHYLKATRKLNSGVVFNRQYLGLLKKIILFKKKK